MARVRGKQSAAIRAPGAPTLVGRWWVDDSGRLLPHHMIADNRVAARIAFTHYGMANVSLDRYAATIRWNIATISDDSMAWAAMTVAQRHPQTEITLEFFWGGWRCEPGYDIAGALERITQLATYRYVDPFIGSAMVERPIDDAMGSEGVLIAKTFDSWERSAGSLTHEHMSLLSPFFLTFRPDRSERDLRFGHVGLSSAGVNVWGVDWAREAPGRVCHRSQPDFEYDDRVCETYYRVLETGEPQLEHVRALIRRENCDPAWLSYRRLVVPARDRMGVPTVVSVCTLGNDLAIPFMAA